MKATLYQTHFELIVSEMELAFENKKTRVSFLTRVFLYFKTEASKEQLPTLEERRTGQQPDRNLKPGRLVLLRLC